MESKRILLTKEAVFEITTTAIWYEEQQTGIGDVFKNEIESALKKLVNNLTLLQG